MSTGILAGLFPTRTGGISLGVSSSSQKISFGMSLRVFLDYLPCFFFPGLPFGISVVASVSHGVLPVKFFRAFSKLYLVVNHKISNSDYPKFFFTDFLGIIPRTLFGISNRNFPEVLGAPFGILSIYGSKSKKSPE